MKTDKRAPLNGWAPGEYMNYCSKCGDCFESDKRASTCADCAYAASPPSPEGEREPVPFTPFEAWAMNNAHRNPRDIPLREAFEAGQRAAPSPSQGGEDCEQCHPSDPHCRYPACGGQQAQPGDGGRAEALETARALVEFARHIIKTYAWGQEVDGGDVQDTAERLGLLVEVPYDPAVHGENDCDALPGDPWFVFADALNLQTEQRTGE